MDPEGSPAPRSGAVPGSAAPGASPGGAGAEGSEPSAGGADGSLSVGLQSSGCLAEFFSHCDFFLPFFFEHFDDGSVVDFFLSLFFLSSLAAAVVKGAGPAAAAVYE